MTGVTLADKATCTITYGYSVAGSDTTAVAPSSPTTSKFTTSEASTPAGKLNGISTSPTVSVKRSARVITMAANGYTTSAKSGKYNVGAKTNDTDKGAAITYDVTPTALDSAGCSVNGAGIVRFTHTGKCTVVANAAATTNFVGASPVQQVINVYSVLPTIVITFNSDGGSAVASRSGVIGSAIKLPAAPKYAGYTFDGWSLLPPGQGGSILSSPYTLTASVTMYAQWTQDIENITFNSEGGSEVPRVERLLRYDDHPAGSPDIRRAHLRRVVRGADRRHRPHLALHPHGIGHALRPLDAARSHNHSQVQLRRRRCGGLAEGPLEHNDRPAGGPEICRPHLRRVVRGAERRHRPHLPLHPHRLGHALRPVEAGVGGLVTGGREGDD